MPVTGEHRLLIDGMLRGSSDGGTFAVTDPSTEAEIGVVADGTVADMEAAIAAARRAFDERRWATDASLRARCLRQLQDAMSEEREMLRRDLVAEIGCAVRMTYGDQLDRPIEKLGFYANLAETYEYGTRLDHGDGSAGNWLYREPAGVWGRSRRGTSRSSSASPRWERHSQPVAPSS